MNESQRSSFTGIPVHDDFEINEDNMSINIFQIFFRSKIFGIIHDESNKYTQQTCKRNKQGFLKPKLMYHGNLLYSKI